MVLPQPADARASGPAGCHRIVMPQAAELPVSISPTGPGRTGSPPRRFIRNPGMKGSVPLFATAARGGAAFGSAPGRHALRSPCKFTCQPAGGELT